MNKQRICIVGDGLSGLMTALVVSQVPGIEVNLVAKKTAKNFDKRTTAISDTNFKFIKENITHLKRIYFGHQKIFSSFMKQLKKHMNIDKMLIV